MSNLAVYSSDYGISLKYTDLPSDVLHLAKRFIIDTIGCALGGYDSDPSKVAREVAGAVTPAHPVTVMARGQSSSLDLAAFTNGVMIRFLDFNNGYNSQESGPA